MIEKSAKRLHYLYFRSHSLQRVADWRQQGCPQGDVDLSVSKKNREQTLPDNPALPQSSSGAYPANPRGIDLDQHPSITWHAMM